MDAEPLVERDEDKGETVSELIARWEGATEFLLDALAEYQPTPDPRDEADIAAQEFCHSLDVFTVSRVASICNVLIRECPDVAEYIGLYLGQQTALGAIERRRSK